VPFLTRKDVFSLCDTDILHNNSKLYQIENLGDDDEGQIEFTSEEYGELMEQNSNIFFSPRGMRNLALVDELESLAPLIGLKFATIDNDDTPQMHVLCGKNQGGSLHILRRGIQATELAVSELPGYPQAIWTLRMSTKGTYLSCTQYSSII
jgi:splicing factor 3B subunit 3